MAARFPGYVPAGVIPAALMPFNEDLSIDEKSLRAHIRDLASVRGISALCVNGVSQEIPGLTLDEQRRALDVMADEVGDQVPLMHGVYAHGPLDAARIARQAEAGGASCLLVFPPAVFVRGAAMLPEMTLGHYKAIADATDLPLIVFQYETSTGMAHPLDTLVKLAEAVPSVMAIKDRSNNPIEHERNIRVLQSLARPVNVLTTHSAWLMPSLVLGCNGILSGSGSVHADLHVALWEAVQANDLAAARAINDQIYPMASCFYSAPTLDMHTRMKEALVMLGRLPSGRVRLPWVDLSDAERARVRAALVQAGRLPA
ncbi:dihydrodipicolinate synthase [Bordetella pertussis]|uniref:Dihydrodipicolinate synthase n=4 Tax=Bordetella pertussis TaxID=520 RepID=A0A0E7UJV9_BORPT|nr:dihydrodipicolinate synthase family protein [Bordetella pertussis]ETH40768.1 dihydrodipicolinate synthetase family protein [Bordetella pertussis H918]ETH42660.1 dihydrodipicolinate synthetase family protein [Bordetella pertussis H939]ETH46400.1 dihydrodipicolinate synthetase family protein [Bordetella pertussis H921]ETH69891.1 dihydrodipicolinate synthetase family protein [Bordetella pertussis STO1-CHLA-0011]ETH83072.1 dihydrodipicolinate synthetase family protein [Bordetella pertussis STO1